MSRIEDGTDSAHVGAMSEELHALRDIIGPYIGALIKEYVKG